MVQIMSDSGHCSRNRAERASLDGKPEYPDSTAVSATNQISNIAPPLFPSPALSSHHEDVVDGPEDEEYENYSLTGTSRDSILRGEETNNNLSDSDKGFVADPWAVTSSFVPPQFDNDTDEDNHPLNVDTPNNATNVLEGYVNHVNLSSTFHSQRSPPPATSSGRNYRSLASKKRHRSKKSRTGSSSSGGSTISKRSTQSLQPRRATLVHTRRRSTQSSGAEPKRRMDADINGITTLVEPRAHQEESARSGPTVVETETPSTSTIPYCYRCFLKFAKYSHWKKHAIYEHILAKNPYPIVEMNYIDPASLGIEVVNPNVIEDHEEDATYGAITYIGVEEGNCIDELGGSTLISEDSTLGGLKLCIGREKGAYVVKRKSLGSLESNTDDNGPPPPLVEESPSSPQQQSQSTGPSDLLHNNPMPIIVMPMLMPCSTKSPETILSSPPKSNVPQREMVNLEAQYRSMVSIESELETVFSGEMDEFEQALEFAMERSRIAAGSPTLPKPLPTAGSGGVAIPGGGVRLLPPSDLNYKMISEDVPVISPSIAVESSDDIDVSEANLIKLLTTGTTPVNVEGSRIPTASSQLHEPSLVIAKKPCDEPGDVDPKASNKGCNGSSTSKDLENPDEENVEKSTNSTTKDVQTIEGQDESEERKGSSLNGKESTADSQNLELAKEKDADLSKREEVKALVEPTRILPDGSDNEADDFECQVCHKVFMSDDELRDHFSEDHFRLAEGVGILEPESPYPPPQTPQHQSNLSARDASETERGSSQSEVLHKSVTSPSSSSHSQQTQAHSLINVNGPGRSQPPSSSNMTGRPSTDNTGGVGRSPFGASTQGDLQNILWRNQANAAAAHAQQQQRGQGSVVASGFPGVPRPMGQSQGPGGQQNMGGISSRAPGPPNQSIIACQPVHHYTSNQPRASFGMGGQQGPLHPQRLSMQSGAPHHRISPPHYPMSLHNALTGVSGPPNEVRPNKEPRVVVDNQLLIQRQVRPAEIRPTQVNHNVAAAIGSVGSAGVNSVRLGNSITLSVCPTNSTHNSPATSPALQDLGLKQSSRSSSPAQAHHSVLAVRGVTVTPASPPITGISPVSSPSPSHSPVASSLTQHQIQQQQKAQASVIQRGPTSMSPPRENPPRDDNFSPPVISTVRGNVQPATTQSIPLQQAAASHNFAIPRPPPPIHRMQYSSSSYGMGVTVNSTAQRPDRPPTVDLTDDDVQTHAQQRISGVPQNHQMMNPPPIRRFVAAQAATFPQQRSSTTMDRLPSCNICGLMFPSILSLDTHKMSNHAIPRSNQHPPPPANVTSPTNGGTRPQQPSPVRSALTMSRPMIMPGHGAQPSIVRAPQVPGSVSILRSHQPTSSQIRSQSPNRPSISNSPVNNNGKYLYIPLLDMGRMDANKMRKLEEIGITCVVPLQGNNTMTQMGIPIMSLRGDMAISQHVPWDSVLPMGPISQATLNEPGNGNNRINSFSNNNNNNNTSSNNNGGASF
ncbi:hypothetical protein Fcan01_02943 [Folsomia candida]|uniref:C2H2-type domain-containing protein n=1 Tax=Folsomia candida TaxID=158441 RepID=A0A226F2B9_FOLCA|nr:hypothetical protein Fcan01_02943 [Folsomia candida]